MLGWRVDSIRSGRTVLTADEYAALGANGVYLYKRAAFEAAAAAPDDTNKAKLALTLFHPDRNIRLQHYLWTNEERAPFETAIDNVDKQIVAAAKYARMWRAIVWSYERSYMTGEAVNVFKAIYEHPIRTIGTIVGIIGLQAIPGVDVAVDIVLIIEFGLDILQTAADLYDMFTSAGAAHSVVAMEHAAAKMGGIGCGGEGASQEGRRETRSRRARAPGARAAGARRCGGRKKTRGDQATASRAQSEGKGRPRRDWPPETSSRS